MMQSVECGPNKYKFSVTNGSSEYHKNMLMAYFLKPFVSAMQGIADEFAFKMAIFIGSLPAMFALDLFTTPSDWWKGLLYLVVIDWLSGMINAIYRSNFDWNVATSKWYQVVAYIMVCGASAVISNTFDSIFWYFQYLVYATFFLKEFVSILKTFRVLAALRVVQKMVMSDKNIPDTSELMAEIEKEFKKNN